MKKFFAIVAATTLVFTVSAAEAFAPSASKKTESASKTVLASSDKSEKKCSAGDWEFLSFCLFPGFPEPADVVDVNGIKVGIPVSFGTASTVNGVDVSFGASMSNEVNGVQTAPLFNVSNKICGLQFSIANVVKEATGLQLGIVNVAQSKSTQIGLLNFIKESPLGFMIIFNCRY